MEGKATILIVDDSPSDRALFRKILERASYTVFDVDRGRDALAKAVEVRPHLVVLDVNIPDLGGLDVCRAIRSDPRLDGMSVLMLTVRHDDHDVLAGLDAGADDYVAKDSAPELMLARVRRLVEFRHLESMALLNRQLVQMGRLLAGIVHEIRGPVSVIRGYAEFIRDELTGHGLDTESAEAILRQSNLLQRRLNHLMTAVRSGPPQIEPVDLPPLVKEAADLYTNGLPIAGRKIRLESLPHAPMLMVNADPGRVLQVLIDLLSNAFQAISTIRDEGRVMLHCEKVTDETGVWGRIEIQDDGPGVPEAIMGRIFEPFFTTKENGSGYGLFLASEIIKEQGGRLTLSANPKGGACFSIWLPCCQTEAGLEAETV